MSMESGKKGTIVALYGIGGLYNYGCEAIVRGTTFLLQQANPNVYIIYYTPRKSEDEKIIADLGIEVKQIVSRHLSLWKRIYNKISKKMYSAKRFSIEDFDNIVASCDILVSIGGDIYTIPEYLRKQNKYNYYNSLIEIGKRIEAERKKMIIIGASIGPFGEYKAAVEYYKTGLSKVNLILAREKQCIDYLNSIGAGQNTMFMPDPAFYVRVVGSDSDVGVAAMHHKEISNKEQYVGINLSPLSLIEVYGEVTEEESMSQVYMIQSVMDATGLEAMLIPHVLSPNENDNDYKYLKKVYERMDSEHQKNTILVKPESFLDVKNYVHKCRFVIAARMHCAVNSLCEGVPVLLLSYSSKSIGMAEYVYGNRNWVLPLKSSIQEIIDKAVELNSQSDILSVRIQESIKQIRTNLYKNTAFIKLCEYL